ncbi:MAG TPA: transcriptional regulator [Nitrospirae bacterium]|nr:transcriptional regulator [Nitrospirota bacterium]HDZ88908.1 transcriptional regulator [Nitrospirota bacterium]
MSRISRPKESFVPVERRDTVRQEIISILEGSILTAREISGRVSISEKDVYEHLNHIQISMNRGRGYRLTVTPSECRKCGFVFKKRDKLAKPGRCPICRNQSIADPLFSIKR